MGDRWGWSMAGCEDAIREAAQLAIAGASGTVRYLEIGVACGDTFGQVCAILEAGGKPWEAVALDLPDVIPAEEDDPARLDRGFNAIAFEQNISPFTSHVRVVRHVAQWWLRRPENAEMFSLVLLDSCHERLCVRTDFEAVEPHVSPGGCLIVHDTAPWSQEQPAAIQPHLWQPLQVRLALEDLSLLPCTRPGWHLVREAPGVQELQGRGCIVYRRVGAITPDKGEGNP